jgi:hypothetical protein
MSDFYQRIEGQLGQKTLPPLDRWSPALSGDIDIRIDAQGRWFHEGSQIERQPLIALFARILRREADGHYYLLTPHEKWRIRVADYPLRALAVDRVLAGGYTRVRITVNNDLSYDICSQYPIILCPNEEGAYVRLDYGVTAKLDRPAWYQLCEWVQSDLSGLYLESAGETFRLS